MEMKENKVKRSFFNVKGIGAPADAFYSLSIGAVDQNGAVINCLDNF
jgi:hypothetical protein